MAPRPKPRTDTEGSPDPADVPPPVTPPEAAGPAADMEPDAAPVTAAAEPATEAVLVRSRWLGVDPIMVHDPAPRVVLYGHELEVTLEQLEDERTPAVAWTDDWTPDPVLDAQCRLAAGLTIDEASGLEED